MHPAGGGLESILRILAMYAAHCIAVPHPWEDGQWQLQCHNASAAGSSVGLLTEMHVVWS